MGAPRRAGLVPPLLQQDLLVRSPLTPHPQPLPLTSFCNSAPVSSSWRRTALSAALRSLCRWNVVTGVSVKEQPSDVFGFDDGEGNRFFVGPNVRANSPSPGTSARVPPAAS